MSRRRGRERRGKRAVIARMMRPSVLAGLGGGLLLAVLLGVTMGNAAVEGINPMHYRPPTASPKMVRPVEASYSTLAWRQPGYDQPYDWAEGEQARTAACGVACDGGVESGYSASVPYFGSREEMAEAERVARREIDQSFATETEAAMTRKDRPGDGSRGAHGKAGLGFVEDVIALGDQE